jgi:predicted amidohydrolase
VGAALRFPVWSRNDPAQPYDLLLYVANWPQARIEAWNTLLRARAIENVSYVVGANRVGNDGRGQPHPGQSAFLDMQGHYLAQAGNMQTVLTRTLKAQALQAFRGSMPFLLDADGFLYSNQ